jgi:hypothetical protein
MPIHDWTRVDAGTFHDFHCDWTIEICRTLNRGLLPTGYFAMVEQRVSGPKPKVATERAAYAHIADRIAVRRSLVSVVAMIEVVSPGNKDSKHAIRSFITKAIDFLRNGINLVVIDLFPPTPRDPEGIHQLIWDELADEPFAARPADKPLTVAGYDAGEPVDSLCRSRRRRRGTAGCSAIPCAGVVRQNPPRRNLRSVLERNATADPRSCRALLVTFRVRIELLLL